MRITTFRHAGGTGWGLVEGDGIVDLSGDPSLPYADASEALRSETVMDLALSACGLAPQHRLAEVTLLAPLPAPRRVLVVIDGQITELDQPEVARAGTAMPGGSRMLAVVIGSPTREVARERAVEHLLGATDAVLGGRRLTLGPWVVSRDETGDLDALHDAGRGLADIVSEASRRWSLSSGDVVLVPAC
ncbi:Rv2993c-like domain-containing protein [Nocardioides sp. R1-1]|uniref:fumarylacetoacetate hydrolase family protein n=1 Tax=Nocardioides sp. R1-1 TaxID=3383502 RepID=UPI0038D1BDE1